MVDGSWPVCRNTDTDGKQNEQLKGEIGGINWDELETGLTYTHQGDTMYKMMIIWNTLQPRELYSSAPW